MILSFKVENFLSFRDTVEFSMIPSAYKKNLKHIFNHEQSGILKISAIYGANASGKSNFVKAIKFLKLLIVNEEYRGRIRPTYFDKFKLDETCAARPSKFTIVFRTTEDNIYEYSIHLDNKTILKESLFLFKKRKKQLIFERFYEKSNNQYKLNFPESLVKTTENRIRLEVYQELLINEKPFLSMAERVETLIYFSDAYYWFEEQLEFLFPQYADNGVFLRLYITDEEFRKKAYKLIINNTDLGISDIIINDTSIHDFFGASEIDRKLKLIAKLEEVPYIFFEQEGKEFLIIGDKEKDGPRVKRLVFKHVSKNNNNDILFEVNEESDGTRRLFHLLPSIIHSIDKSKVYIVDEIDRSMHPILIKELLRTYIDEFNHDAGQMIFTTHESFLMDLNLLRQDEFWFVEKNQESGTTEMYSLTQFKPRFDFDIKQNYLEGKFGAIPFINKPDW